jgi:hypothetical protein
MTNHEYMNAQCDVTPCSRCLPHFSVDLCSVQVAQLVQLVLFAAVVTALARELKGPGFYSESVVC